MRKELDKYEYFSYSLLYFLIIYSFSLIFSDKFKVDIGGIKIFFISIIVAIFVKILIEFSVTKYLFSLFFFIFYIFFSYLKNISFGDVNEFFLNFFANLKAYLGGYESLKGINDILLWITILFIFSLIIFFIMFKFRGVKSLLIFCLSIIIWSWYNYIDKGYIALIIFIFAYIIFYILEIYRRENSNFEKEKIRNNSYVFENLIKLAIKYSLLIVLIAVVFPKFPNILEISSFSKKVTNAFPIISELRTDIKYSRTLKNPKIFDFSKTGFQNESGRLGGPVTLDNTKIMEVKSPLPLYLRGNIKTLYTGDKWSFVKGKKVEYDTGEKIYSDIHYGNIIDIDIKNINLASFNIFTPYQPIFVEIDRDSKIWVDSNYQIFLQGARYKNEDYKIKAILPYLSNGNMIDYSMSEDKILEYLQLPDDFSDSVIELSKNITISTENNFEKAKIIEEYLRNNYEYDLNTSLLPYGRDFVEYFLMEEKRGYCTHFASAMVTMLRSLNIPARYIEGFKMPTANKNGVYDIRNSNAHAWVECFFYDYGWITFEPTPAYILPEYKKHSVLANDEKRVDFDFNYEKSFFRLEDNKNLESENYINEKDEGSINKSVDKNIFIKLIFYIIFFSIFFRIIYMKTKIKRYMKLLENHSDRELYMYRNIIRIFEKLDYKMRMGETHLEYSNRIKSKFYDSENSFFNITEIFIKSKYSRSKCSDEDFKKIKNYFIFIDNKLRYKMGIFKYFIYKYLRGNLYNMNF